MIHARHHAWLRWIARTGYAARGIVYLIVGGLICAAAFSTSEEYGVEGALRSLTGVWWGTTLLWAIAAGFTGYVVWRLIQSCLDTDDHGWTPKGIAVRGGLFASAMTHIGLIAFVLGLLGLFGASGGGEEKGPVLEALGSFFGTGMVNLGGALIFAGVAGAHIFKAAKRGYAKHFKADEATMRFIHPVSMVGLFARGVVFALIALLFFGRWWNGRGEAGEVPSMTDALDAARGLPFGEYIYLAFGIGLIAFALYSLAEARWRQINVEDADAPTEQSAN